MHPTIDGMQSEEIEFHGTDLNKIDGSGNKTVRAANGQDLIIQNKIDGRGTHKLIGFGYVEVREKVDGEGDRWFIDCGRVVVNDRKDGLGNLYLVNSPCQLAKKAGGGNIIWCGAEPKIESKGFTQMGEIIEDQSIASHSEGQRKDEKEPLGPGSQRSYGEQGSGSQQKGLNVGSQGQAGGYEEIASSQQSRSGMCEVPYGHQRREEEGRTKEMGSQGKLGSQQYRYRRRSRYRSCYPPQL